MATLEWAAGFIDGEGCLDIYRTKRQHTVRLTVVNTSLIALNVLKELFGGRISLRKQYKKTHKQTWQITWAGKLSIQPILQALLPFLIVKKEQAEFVLQEWMPRISGPGHRSSPEELLIRDTLQKKLSDFKHIN